MILVHPDTFIGDKQLHLCLNKVDNFAWNGLSIYRNGLLSIYEGSKQYYNIEVKELGYSSMYRLKVRFYNLYNDLFVPVGEGEVITSGFTTTFINYDPNTEQGVTLEDSFRVRDLKKGMISSKYHKDPGDLIPSRFEVLEVEELPGSYLTCGIKEPELNLIIANGIILGS